MLINPTTKLKLKGNLHSQDLKSDTFLHMSTAIRLRIDPRIALNTSILPKNFFLFLGACSKNGIFPASLPKDIPCNNLKHTTSIDGKYSEILIPWHKSN